MIFSFLGKQSFSEKKKPNDDFPPIVVNILLVSDYEIRSYENILGDFCSIKTNANEA